MTPGTCLDEGGSVGGTATPAAEGKQEKVEGAAEAASPASSRSFRDRFCSSAACRSLESTKFSKTSKLPASSCEGNKTVRCEVRCEENSQVLAQMNEFGTCDDDGVYVEATLGSPFIHEIFKGFSCNPFS